MQAITSAVLIRLAVLAIGLSIVSTMPAHAQTEEARGETGELSVEQQIQSDAPRMKAIIVEGNRRVNEETIEIYADIREGSPLTREALLRVRIGLLRSGLFTSVDAAVQRNNLVITVLEKPVVYQVVFNRVRREVAIEDKELYRVIELRQRSLYTAQQLLSDRMRLMQYYVLKEYPNVNITTEVKELGNNLVTIIYNIDNPKIRYDNGNPLSLF